ncbi:MAG: hypothetical protein ACE1Z1_00015, partial [Candidatus Acidiferrales bacterium]
QKQVSEICEFMEADSLGYLSLESMRKAVADAEGRYCHACYTGNYPTDFVELQLQADAEAGDKTDVEQAFLGERGRRD